jgi:surfactin synthase thioesterase subunit
LPKRVAQDSLLHTRQSYTQTLDQVVVHQDAKSNLVDIAVPTEVIYGDKESPIIANNFRNLKLGHNIRLQTISGRHNLAIDNKERVLEILKSRPR